MQLLHLICFVGLIGKTFSQERLESLKSCSSDVDCYANSFCFNNDINQRGNCKCLDNYVIWRNNKEYECLLPANYSEPCVRDVQCKIYFSLGVCNKNGICDCESDSHYMNGHCYKTAGINERCTNDFNCRAIDKKNIFCNEGICECRYNYRLNPNGICVVTAHLGNQCTNDDTCINMNARCFNGICTCNVGYVESNNLQQCLRAALHMGAPCQQLSQCDAYLEGANCLDSKCACPLDHHHQGNKCYKSVKVGDICNSDKECQLRSEFVGNVICEGNRCVCRGNADTILNECVGDNTNNGNNFMYKRNIFIVIYLIIFHTILLIN